MLRGNQRQQTRWEVSTDFTIKELTGCDATFPDSVNKVVFVSSGVRSSPGRSVCLRLFTPETLRVTAPSENLHPPSATSPCPPTPSPHRPTRTWPSPPTPATRPWPREPRPSSAAGWTSCLHRGAFDLHSWLDQGEENHHASFKDLVRPERAKPGFYVACVHLESEYCF